jgi:UDP-N-acetylmuramoyl-L-alanyl-D-glutamate--2,6-diaminopimelate ligase
MTRLLWAQDHERRIMPSVVKTTQSSQRPEAAEKKENRRRREANDTAAVVVKGRASSRASMRSRQTMNLENLLKAIPVQAIEGNLNCEVRGLAIDSRRVAKGFIFVAVTGQTTDGHLFLADAQKRGAAAVVSERSPQDLGIAWIQTPDARRASGSLAAVMAGEPAKKMEIVGVTGTNGKTTIAYLLDAVFGRLHPPSAMMGTVVHRVGDDVQPARFTTPEAPAVQSFLARAVDEGCRYGVLEVSSHGLALGRAEGTEFACAVFTNLSRDHLDFHRDMENYFAAKRILFDRYLRPDGAAVIGIDDSFGRRLAGGLRGSVSTFGFHPDADLRIENIEASFEGLDVSFRERGERRRISSSLIGRHNALNLLAAYGAGRAVGFETEALSRTLEQAHGAPGRYEKVVMGQPFAIIIDYAHTDDALRNLLETTRALPHRNILTVFGCGGDRDSSKRPLMGAVAARLSDHVVLTSDNPRSEDPLAIIREIEMGTRSPRGKANVTIEPDRRKAIGIAMDLAEPGDVVLLTGKGHEPYQVIGNQNLPFDDREVVREILGGGKES